jgi:hypothetical protein
MSNVTPPDDLNIPDVPVPVIERGHAQEALSAALDDVTAAFLRLEAVAMACARALDGAP